MIFATATLPRDFIDAFLLKRSLFTFKIAEFYFSLIWRYVYRTKAAAAATEALAD